MQLILLIITAILFYLPDISLAADTTDCGTLSTAGTTYVLQNNVTSEGTCFTVTASDVILDLNGKTITYDNANPISVGNGSFESALIGFWDVTGAANATRAEGAYLTPSVYVGSYALKVTTPTANQQVQSVGTITLQPNTRYSLSGMVYNEVADGVQLSIGFDGTLISATQTTKTYRGFQYIYTQFVTGDTEVSYKINLTVTGASSVAVGSVFFDDIRVQQSGHYGVHSGISWARNATVKNGTILQGQAHGDFSHAVYGVGTSPLAAEISGLTINVSGNSTQAIRLSSVNNTAVYKNIINSAVDTICIRDKIDGSLIYIAGASANGSIYNNIITSGIQNGIYATSSGAVSRIDIYNNDITLQSKYTNDFAISQYGNYGNNIHDNVIKCGYGSNACRGIYSNSKGGAIYNNTIEVHSRANNQEYSGCAAGGAYGIQLEDLAVGVDVYRNIVTANADECESAAFRHFGPSSTTGANNYVHGNTFRALAVNGSKKVASSVRILETFAQHLNFTGNILNTNSCWIYIDGINTTSLDRNLVLNGNTYQLSYPKAATYHPLLDNMYDSGVGAPRNVTLSNNIYTDTTVKIDMENAQFVSKYLGYTNDPYVYNIVISGDIQEQVYNYYLLKADGKILRTEQ